MNREKADRLSPMDYARALHEAIWNSRERDHDRILDNLIEILRSNQDLDQIQEIEDEFTRLQGETKVHAGETNRELLDELNQQLVKKVDREKMETLARKKGFLMELNRDDLETR